MDNIKTRTNNRKKRFIVDETMVNREINVKTFRYNFSESLLNELEYFSQIHRYDERKMFKESWNQWIQTPSIANLINAEITKLNETQYKGNVLEKMFTSARYYFKKKPIEKIGDDVKPQKKRKIYTTLQYEFLECIDKHALEHIQLYAHQNSNDTATKWISNISPASSYLLFCESSHETIEKQIKYLESKIEGKIEMTIGEIHAKIKKTYKNRFHLMKQTVEEIKK